MNRVVGENERRHIVELALVLFAPCLCTAQTRFFRARKNHADFGVFKFNAFILQGFQNRNTHVAARKVVVCTVNNAVFVPHPIKTDKERHEYQTAQSELEKQRTCINHAKRNASLHDDGNNGNYEVVDCADAAENCVSFKTDAAELVVDGPFPCCVGVAVEENTAFDFACAFFDSRYVVPCFFGEATVNQLFVKSELHKYNKQTCNNQQNRSQREYKEQRDCEQNKGDGEINPAEERTGIFFKGFHVGTVASAVLFEYLCHVFACLLFTLGPRTAFFKVFADICNFI